MCDPVSLGIISVAITGASYVAANTQVQEAKANTPDVSSFPAPTPIFSESIFSPETDIQKLRKREMLRAGLMRTIKTSAQGLKSQATLQTSSMYPTLVGAKKLKLGE